MQTSEKDTRAQKRHSWGTDKQPHNWWKIEAHTEDMHIDITITNKAKQNAGKSVGAFREGLVRKPSEAGKG